MKSDSKLLGYYNYTVVLTYIGMLMGFLGILCILDNCPEKSVICLMLAGVCDMFDGTVASTRKRTCQEKNFGIQIDSLSDLLCFGALPAILIYSLDKGNMMVTAVACFYVLCTLIRLAYFNVDEQERQQQETGSRSIYYGLPVTTSALIIPIVYGVSSTYGMNTVAALAAVLGAMGALFLIPFELKKPKVFGKICMLMLGVMEFLFVILSFGDIL